MTVQARLATPAAGRGAIGVIAMTDPDAIGTSLDAVLENALDRPVPIGAAKLRHIAGVDHGLVVRWAPQRADLMPHGGPAVMRGVLRELEKLGAPLARAPAPFPEAADEIEQRMLDAIARAASPLAIDLLVDQPRRWRGLDPHLHVDVADHAVLQRLIDPPLVAAVGRPSVGKSTLVNALAGRDVALVHASPGTTRDHLGVLIDLGGLVVRYLDTPGLPEADATRDDAIESAALEIAQRAVVSADLLLLCGDAERPPPGAPDRGIPALRVSLREDLAKARWPCDVRVSALDRTGLTALTSAVKESLVPASALADPRPWRFWDAQSPRLSPHAGNIR